MYIIQMLNDICYSIRNPLLIFSGGLPQDHTGDHHAVTIMHGVEHVALDFSSPVVDMFPING